MARSRPRSRQVQARPRRIRLFQRWRGWRRHHSHSAAESLAKVLQQPVASVMTWLVIGIAIALPAGLWVVLDNVARVSAQWDSPARLSVFLGREVSAERAQALALEWQRREDVRAVRFVHRDQALEAFIRSSKLGDVAADLPENPLPHLLLVDPAREEAGASAGLRDALAAATEVDEVVLDSAWLQRLAALMALGRRAVSILAVLLLAAVVLVLGNTMRLAIESRREEIVIIKLVGGSDAFARRPLLYTGLWFGLGGGVCAALLVTLGVALLAGAVEALARAYQSAFELRGPSLLDSLHCVLTGAALGLAGAWLAVARHLRAIEPR